jgi:hypothetical protein
MLKRNNVHSGRVKVDYNDEADAAPNVPAASVTNSFAVNER